MGHVFEKVRITNPNNKRYIVETALVDTGATDTVLPKFVADKIGLKSLRQLSVETANGTIKVEEAICTLRIKGKTKTVPVVIAKNMKRVLIGVTTLETMGLNVDTKRRKLIKEKVLLY